MSLWGSLLESQINNINIFFYLLLITPIIFGTVPKIIRLRSIYRIGPHNKDILSIIFGSLLGDAYAEKRLLGVGTRINFYQESTHREYILYLHKILSNSGYCNSKLPITTNRLGIGGKIRKIVRFSTWTYTSFNWIRDVWYKDNIKCVPNCIGEYLTPLALAIWIMDDGSKVGTSLKFSTNSFTYDECLILVKVLNDNFKLKSSIQLSGTKNQYIIYIWKESMNDLRKIVSPYIIPEMRYKIY
jgi:ubiquinol-cytochrome c reductase cytochrome b subunit